MALVDVCTRHVNRISPDATARQAACLMRDKHIGALVVVVSEGGRDVPVGIVTDRDLVTKALTAKDDPGHVTVRQAMTEHPTTARETDDVLETARVMEQASVRRLPLVDASGSLTGIVSVGDLYRLLAEELATLSRISPRQRSSERLGAPAPGPA